MRVAYNNNKDVSIIISGMTFEMMMKIVLNTTMNILLLFIT